MNRSPRRITVLGGGLGGLALARALAQRDLPVTLHEAGLLPRHRVCGEFIAGLPRGAVDDLALDDPFRGALALRTVAWYRAGYRVRSDTLPAEAVAISRHLLDSRLAEDFERAGGQLRLSSRVPVPDDTEGVVVATGRKPDPRSPWVGLKVHLRRSSRPRLADLELHLGRRAYVGVSAVEDGRLNVCGLFRFRPSPGRGVEPLAIALEQAGLAELAAEVRAGDPDPASACAVAGMDYADRGAPAALATLGDRSALIPPFTGHGMALALAEANALLEPAARWSRGEAPWGEVLLARDAFAARTRPLRRLARVLHPWLWSPVLQPLLATAARLPGFPFTRLYSATHLA